MRNEPGPETILPDKKDSKITTTPAPFKPVPAVVNAIRLMRSLSQTDVPLNLTEAARRADVPIPTALKILRTLASEGIVSQPLDKKPISWGWGCCT